MQVEIAHRFSADLDEVALNSPEATFYHTGTWIESLSHTYPSMQFQCLIARSGAETFGFLPYFVLKKGPIRAVWSMPFGTYGGPVTLGDDAVHRLLLDTYVRMRKHTGVHEMGMVDFQNRISGGPFRIEDAATHLIELKGDFEEIWKNDFEKSKRRQTRKARREGLSVTEARSVDEVKGYYELDTERTKKWGKRSPYAERLFIELFTRGGGDVRLFLARSGDELIGGHLNFYFKDSVIAWNGVTRDMRAGREAGTLLYSECIRHACERGFRHYNLGASLEKRSLIDYKESLGGVTYEYRIARWRSIVGRAAVAVKAFLSGH